MKPCDHTSVGIIAERNRKVLLIDRRRPPYGFAPPAGHVDGRSSFLKAAQAELREEVGLTADALELIGEGVMFNRCRRSNGHHHHWKIYRALRLQGLERPAPKEAKSLRWATRSELLSLAQGAIRKKADQKFNGEFLEEVWVQWLSILGYVSLGMNAEK